ncbi:MAG: glycerol kinase GlpK, partial [Candidatus Eremiobacteraeota bacterium]|nr:glycerol kinase GlpK [Candidatus Eremiobacteraeota bacterium]
ARQTGLRLDPYFSATKIAWILDHQPALRRRAGHGDLAFGTIDTWLLWNLTGGRVHATDYTNASRTLLFDIERLAWSDELLRAFEIPAAILPQTLPSLCDFGTTASELFGAAVPIAGIAGDQQAALVGQAGFRPGIAKCTYGTGGFIVLHTGERIVHSSSGLLATIAIGLEKNRATYAFEGSIFIAGAAVQWLRDGLGVIAHSNDVEALAAQVPDSGGVVFVPAFAGLGAPYWDPHARGTIAGITRGTTRAHLARATLDAIALQVADVIEAMERDAGAPLAELRADGGAAANDLLLQLQADALGVDVLRPQELETTALGAAYLAGIQCGLWDGFDEVAAHWRSAHRFRPRTGAEVRAATLARWRKAIDRMRADGSRA